MQSVAIDPAGVEWTRVDPKFIPVRVLSVTVGWLITLAAVLVPSVLTWTGVWNLWSWLIWTALAVVLVWGSVDVALEPRRTRAIGYHEREDDLLIRKGLLWQQVVAVPYGRMQYVDIEAGPLMRRFKICTVQLKTASATTDAKIPGVRREEGARLRDELSARGQARLAGL